jgi:hypothetical protein
VVHLFLVGACLQRSPVKLAGVAQIHAALGVVQHVHALVRVELERHVLKAQLGLEQVVVVLERQAHGLVARVIGGGAHFVARQVVPGTAGEVVGLEVGTGGVVVGLAGGAAVADVEGIRGMGDGHVGATRLVVAPVEGTDFALGDALAGWRELGCTRLRQMVPPMLSPPALTGEMPAKTLSTPTLVGSRYDNAGFMWLGQDAIRSMPSTLMRRRSSARPWMAGRLDTPPAPYRLTPGISDSRLAVSLVADRRGARPALSSLVAPGAVLSSLESLTVTAGRAMGFDIGGNGAAAQQAQGGHGERHRQGRVY